MSNSKSAQSDSAKEKTSTTLETTPEESDIRPDIPKAGADFLKMIEKIEKEQEALSPEYKAL